MWLFTFARFPCRGVRWLLTFTGFSTQGCHVTPHLRALSAQGHQFPSPSRAFLRGDFMHREGALSPWLSERAESSTHGSRWCGAVIIWMRECALHTAAADVGLLSCEWESVLYTQQPLMRGCYHVNESVLYTWQPLMWGWYHVNERLSSTHGSRWWGAGIVWMSEELSDCALHTAERHSEAGVACLDSGFFRAASAAMWDPFAPASALGSPNLHGRGTWEVRLMSCPAGLTGERNADI